MLAGDTDYAHLMHANAKQVDHLVATHDGAGFNAGAPSVPKPNSGRCQLVISCGYRNVYGHPHPDGLSKHAMSGWTTYVTTTGRGGIAARGDRILN
ncbi:hypothetical protein [Bradyrhizobium arachidis]|uniref:hypothetical protein n=1 Tax=Bradyrhizobium arachidis TaxID=858423 RepID=UPI001160CAF1|nr:hypothetical protein [Bradyrhizobium arachidis]